MSKLEKLIDSFQLKLDKFMIGCDAIEEEGRWNKDLHGEMEHFYVNDLVSIIIRLIAADGVISEKEADYLNDAFGFDYTPEELTEVYRSCEDEIGLSFDEDFENGISYMRELNDRLADSYKELLALICEIIVESDGVVSEEEAEEINHLKALCA